MTCTTCAPATGNTTAPICPDATPCPARACTPSSYVCGDWTTTTAADCTQTRTRTANNFVDGIYQNPTITILNGCISRVVNGTNVIQQRPEPCTAAGAVVPPVTAALTLSPQPGNTLRTLPDGLFSGVSVDTANSNIAITGAGTPVAPFTFNVPATAAITDVQTSNLTRTQVGNVITLNTFGINYTACGINIQSGVIKAWTAPITTINAGSGVIVAPDMANCAVQISVDNKIVTGVTCGGAFVDPTNGNLPVNGAWTSIGVTVNGSRLFMHSPIPATVFDEFGAVIGNAPSVQVFANNAAAQVAMDSIYTFAGNAAC